MRQIRTQEVLEKFKYKIEDEQGDKSLFARFLFIKYIFIKKTVFALDNIDIKWYT